MGLLTSTNGRKVFVEKLLKFGPKISIFSYFIGLLWMILLAHHELNAKNYFSENQLLPGLVHTYFTTEHYTSRVYNKLQNDCSIDSSLVKNHVISEMNNIGLDVFTQDFNIKSLGLNGTNIFGIYRAPRAPGVESIILNVPFRKCKSHGSLALLLGAAKYFQSQTYWAKDIIFLVTDHELYGMKAWLEAYFDDVSSDIDTVDLKGHAGSIQAAVVLDFERDYVSHFDLLIEGLNGQLPNLDLINLAIRIANIEDVPIKFQHQVFTATSTQLLGNLETFIRMMISQASGQPTGNHGLFYKYRIEAISLHGMNDPGMQFTRQVDFEAVGRLLDGILRSVNNMLEHFHQSFFLYVLPNTHRYISIGLYMPPLACMIAPYVVWLAILWVDIFKLTDDSNNDGTVREVVTLSRLSHFSTFSQLFMAIGLGYVNYLSLPALLKQETFKELPASQLLVALVLISFAAVVPSRFLRHSTDELSYSICKLYMSLSTATLIVVLSILNFPAAFFVCLFYTPLTIVTCYYSNGRFVSLLRLLFSIASSPVSMCWIVCIIRHVSLQTENSVDDVIDNSLETFKHVVLTSSLHDSVLGVWTRGMVTLALFPIWVVYTSMIVP